MLLSHVTTQLAMLVGIATASAMTKRSTESLKAEDKPIFAHYMIGGINDDHTRIDIVDAQNAGIDAFAMNFDQFAPWSEGTVNSLFKHADELGFGLFFSFDHAGEYFDDPSEYADFLKKYLGRDSYFKYEGKPLVSTFAGEKVTNGQWASFRKTVGDVTIIPGFHEAKASETFFDDREGIDGVFNWNSWPYQGDGKVNVSTTDDEKFMTAAKDANKLFMLGISPLQFKHLEQWGNWYRRGEGNLENRLLQALDMQPDMIELQTWNDAGESHYMGNIWDEPMTDSPIHDYVDGYNHIGYLKILPAFIKAWKRGDRDGSGMVPENGKKIQGTFWHHTLLVDGDCSADPQGKASDIKKLAEDSVSGIILAAKGQTNMWAVVNGGSGSKELGKLKLKEGYNSFKFDGLVTGKVTVEVWDGSTMIGGGYGPLEVSDKASICNYNFQVVGFPG